MEAQRYSGPGGSTPRFHHKEIKMVGLRLRLCLREWGSQDEEPDPALDN